MKSRSLQVRRSQTLYDTEQAVGWLWLLSWFSGFLGKTCKLQLYFVISRWKDGHCAQTSHDSQSTACSENKSRLLCRDVLDINNRGLQPPGTFNEAAAAPAVGLRRPGRSCWPRLSRLDVAAAASLIDCAVIAKDCVPAAFRETFPSDPSAVCCRRRS